MATHPPQVQPSAESGGRFATGRLMALVMGELRELAAAYLSGERRNHTLRPTELVHEAYLKLADQETPWQSRSHFFAVAAAAVRQVLVDHARTHNASKRGSGRRVCTLHDSDLPPGYGPSIDILELDEALRELAALHPQQHQVVELRFFGGLSIEEIARFLNVAEGTVKNLWRVARARLIVRLRDSEPR